MSITFFGRASSPADNSAKYADPDTPLAIVPPASMLAGDFVYCVVNLRDPGTSVSNSTTGGQTWTAETAVVGGSGLLRAFWCTFNGTWSANPEFTAAFRGTYAKFGISMQVFRPSGTPTWAVDVAQTDGYLVTAGAPYDVTAGNHTAIDSSTVTIATWVGWSTYGGTMALQSGGFTNPGGDTQYRNADGAINGPDMVMSSAYKINSASGAVGAPVNRFSSDPTVGHWMVQTFKDQSAAASSSRKGFALLGVG